MSNIPVAAQLGVAVPFILGLFLVMGWLMKSVDRMNRERLELNSKIIDQVIPALEQSAAAAKTLTEAATDLLSERAVERALADREKNR